MTSIAVTIVPSLATRGCPHLTAIVGANVPIAAIGRLALERILTLRLGLRTVEHDEQYVGFCRADAGVGVVLWRPFKDS
jgi:hypothetical protein